MLRDSWFPGFPKSVKISRPSLGLFIPLMGLLALLLIAACGGDDPTAVSQPAATATQPAPATATQPPPATATQPAPEPTSTPVPVAPPANTVAVSSQGSLGRHLVDADGMTLYLLTNDQRDVSTCSGGCADAWPPLLTDDDPSAGAGLDAERLATIQREDGSSQVTYNGKPLHNFANDQNPGDTLGQDVGGVWFVVTTDGGPVYTNAPVNAAENGDFGTILMDASGRTLYLFTIDERNVSNCAGACALDWPPLITVEDPVPGDGVSAARIGTITREDGSKQVTFDGSPLYYFAADEKPGDAMGQNFFEVWFVISNSEPLMIILGELDGSGQTGFATLTARGDQTEVVLSATAGISELNHIHAGSCTDLGGVVHGLTNMADGASVTTVDATLASLIVGSFAVNLHKAGDASVYTSCGNVAEAGQSLTIALGELDGSGQSGWATLTNRGDQTEVVLSATAGISELNHIHAGSCTDLGGVIHPLTNMADGASVTTVDATLDSLIAGSFAINLHKAGDASVYTSCGNVAEAGQSLTIALGELDGSGQTGFATLTARGDKTEVVLSATAGISELNHIHAGSCTDVGGVVHGLTNMADGASVTTVDVTLDSLIAGSFAVRLHKAGDASVYTSCGNVAEAGQSLTIALGELDGSGQSGWATLTNRGAETEVVLSATAGISELNHIHSGSCTDLGGVVYPLTNMAEGASVTTVDATLDSLIAGSFAVNLHKAGDASVYTSCGNVAEAGQSLTIALGELDGSGQSGWATLTNRGAKTEVVLSATAGISELNHIHSGSCSDLGGVVYPLTNMADGASVTTVDATLDSLIAGSFAINLHKAGDASVYTSCGNVAEAGQSLTIALGEVDGSGQSGWATLTNRGAKTEVVLSATAGISELNHIHAGSCTDLGGVVYGLTNMADGASVTTVDATLDSLIAGSFAINLHKAGDASVYTSCGDI